MFSDTVLLGGAGDTRLAAVASTNDCLKLSAKAPDTLRDSLEIRLLVQSNAESVSST